VSASREYFERAIPAGEYVGWVALPADTPDRVVAGAGVQLRRVLPAPRRTEAGGEVARDVQALVLNVFTERPWRRRGVAALLMHHVLGWARERGIRNVVLHASDGARPLYERLGFVPTSEMRLATH
jgi:GNAT superfamily N-acetyltransferase